MARTDAVVLGAGIVGTSIALHLAKRGLAVALVDRAGPGEGTSYGNAGVIEGNTLLPHPFPTAFGALMKVALKRATEANYHLFFLPRVAPWLLDYRANSAIERRIRYANLMRPLFGAALAEHETLMQESDATRYLRRKAGSKSIARKPPSPRPRGSVSSPPNSACHSTRSTATARLRSSRRWRRNSSMASTGETPPA